VAQDDLGAEGDQQRRRIADGRGVADVAAQRALIADLQRGEALQQLAEVRVVGGQRGVAVGQRCGGADLDMAVGDHHLLHLGDLADVDQQRQRAMELGDFQRQIGAAGDQPGVRVGGVDFGQLGDGQWRQATLVAIAEFGHFTRGDGLELGDGCGFLSVELIRLGMGAGLLGGGEDRPVAGAAAKVAGQRFVGLVRVVFVHSGGVLLQGEQAHDEAWRTEAALRAVAVDHRLLHAVQSALVLEVFDTDQLLAVQRGHEGQAGIEGAVAQAFTDQFADHHGAGATVAGGAALLGTGLATVLAQVLQHRGVGVERALAAQLAVEQKLDQGRPPLSCSWLSDSAWSEKLVLTDLSVKKN